MIAAWMLYCTLCAVALSLAAVVAERVLAGRGPVRHVWTSAVLLSVLVPAAAFRFAPRAAVVVPQAPVVAEMPNSSSLDSSAVASTGAAVTATNTGPGWNWRATLAHADTPLTIAWLTLSSALVAHFLCGMIALNWMRRWWRRDTLQGVEVLVSESTGPALVGALSPAIVVPQWTLAMEASQVELMLRHEEEHRRARDGQLLTAAHFALIAMPWNVALWWQLMRLRVAVELDCDARVLRDADARSYGDLLLEVARPRRRLMLMGATAFAERASQLERRIRAIGRRRAHASRIARLGVAGIGVVVVTAAWVAPRPPAPARTSPRPVPPAPASASPRTDSAAVRTQRPALVDASSSPSAPARSVAAPERPRTTPSPSAQRDLDSVPRQTVAAPGVQDSAALATSPTLERRVVPGNTTVRASTQLDLRVQQQDSIFEHLFAGIALTPDQEAKARDLVNQLEAAQIAQMANAIKALVAAAPLRQAMQAQADSGLEALLTNDADRALLHTRFAPQMAAGRGGGRSATLVGDTTLLIAAGRGARVGGGGFAGPLPGGGGGGGRGGARGGGGVGPTAAADAVELAFRRFFDGIPLTPQQQSDARVIIAKMQADIRATNPPIPGTIIARRGFSNLVTMSPESAAALASLLSDDGDRATLQSHIVIEVRRTIETPPR